MPAEHRYQPGIPWSDHPADRSGVSVRSRPRSGPGVSVPPSAVAAGQAPNAGRLARLAWGNPLAWVDRAIGRARSTAASDQARSALAALAGRRSRPPTADRRPRLVAGSRGRGTRRNCADRRAPAPPPPPGLNSPGRRDASRELLREDHWETPGTAAGPSRPASSRSAPNRPPGVCASAPESAPMHNGEVTLRLQHGAAPHRGWRVVCRPGSCPCCPSPRAH